MTNRLKHSSAILSILLPLLGIGIILTALNLYQYYKVRGDIAVASIADRSSIELIELQNFFREIPDSLNVVREWGKNGILLLDETVTLNKKLFPIIQARSRFSGLILADSSGREYYLYRSDQGLVTRISKVEEDKTGQTWQQWSAPAQQEEKWQENSNYDPRRRPWFVAPGKEEKISWTDVYTFFGSGKPGITASVSWIVPGATDRYMVFGLDILIEDIQKLLKEQQQKREGILFIVNPEGGYVVESSALYYTGTSVSGGDPDQKQVIDRAIESWRATGELSEDVVSFSHNKQRWLAQFRPLGGRKGSIWVGVAASKKAMAETLKNVLFKVDVIDFAVAMAGGLLILALLRRFGWQRAGLKESRELRPEDLMELINKGEGARVEFKASVRHNIKTGKAGKEIELAWLKAVVAFLNSTGGTLLLGVADDGTVVGIKHDDFDSDDRCLLHVKNLLNQHIGAVFFPFMDVTLMRHGNVQVVVIVCSETTEPVFLKIGKTEEFFIRSGPSNTKLSPSQILSYLEKHRS